MNSSTLSVNQALPVVLSKSRKRAAPSTALSRPVKHIKVDTNQTGSLIDTGTCFQVSSVPVTIVQGKVNSKGFIPSMLPPKRKQRALLKLNSGSLEEEVDNGCELNKKVYERFGKKTSRVTQPPYKIGHGKYIQKLYPLTLAQRNQLTHYRFDLNQKLKHLIDIAEGITQLYECDVCQNDIKPSNIFIDKRNRALIGDFNLSAGIGNQVSRFNKPYPYWDRYSQQHEKYRATFATDLVGLAQTIAETIFCDHYCLTQKGRFTKDFFHWRQIYTKRYAIARLEHLFCPGDVILQLEESSNPILEIEEKAKTTSEKMFCSAWAETKAIGALFDFVRSILVADEKFSQVKALKERKKQTLSYFKEPAEYVERLKSIFQTLQNDRNLFLK